MIFLEDVPITVLDSNLVDANIPAWDAATTYAENDTVMQGDYVYQSLADSNTGNQPDITPLKWALIGVRNTLAIWDRKYIHLKSYAPEKIELLIEAGSADTVVFGGLEAVTVEIEQIRNGETYETYTQQTARWLGHTFREYVFEPVDKKERAVFALQPLLKQQLLIRINAPGGTAACSYIVVGKKVKIGKTLPRGEVGIVDFSKKDRTKEGVVYLKPGKVIDDGRYTVLIENGEFDTIKTRVKKRVGTPTIWIPTCKNATVVYGFLKDFRMTLENQTSHQYQIEIEEL